MEKFNKLNWYILTVFVLFFNPFFLFLVNLIQKKIPFEDQIFDFTVNIFLGAIWFYALFRCAYLKTGVKFLIATLFAAVLIHFPGSIWIHISHIIDADSSKFIRMSSLVMAVLVVYWYYNTLQLYKAHKRSHLIRNELYARALAEFEKVVTLAELETQFEKWMRKEESFGAQDVIFEAYKVKKEKFLAPN